MNPVKTVFFDQARAGSVGGKSYFVAQLVREVADSITQHMEGLDYDWIEIGTANFNTQGIGGGAPLSRGALVEPLGIYLDQLIDSPNVAKVNAAVYKYDGQASIYYIPPGTITELGLPWWLHGCNSMCKPHMLNVKELEARGLSLVNIAEETVECITWATLVDRLNVGRVDYLKIIAEGCDCDIVSQVLQLGEARPHLLPARIRFETNEHSTAAVIDATILALETCGYHVTLRGEHTEMVRDAVVIGRCPPKIAMVGAFSPPRSTRFDVRTAPQRSGCDHERTYALTVEYYSSAQATPQPAGARILVCRDPSEAAAASRERLPVAGTCANVVNALTAAGADAWPVTCDAEWEALFDHALARDAAHEPAVREPELPGEDARPSIFKNLVDPPEECIPRLLHMIWVGGAAPEYFWENAFKWRMLMPHWTVRLWMDADLASVPEPVRNAVNSSNCGAQKADILRYWIVYEHGGVYADADIVPHRSLDPIIALGARVVVCHDLDIVWSYVACAFFAAAPKEPLFERASLQSLSVAYNTPDVHMKTGPRLFGECLEAVEGKYTLLPANMLYRNEGNSLRYGTHTYARSWCTP